MRILIYSFLWVLIAASCTFSNSKRVKGNGNHKIATRSIASTDKIKINGFINVELVKSDKFAVEVEADENLHKYIITEKEGEWLVIRPANDINIKTNNPVLVRIHLNQLQAVKLYGSSKVTGTGKFHNNEDIELDITGSGRIDLSVHTPNVDANITGSGECEIAGETRDLTVKVTGSGDFVGRSLKSENARIKLTGSGDAYVFADVTLDASVHGSGAVFYSGNANVDMKVSGSGKVKRES